MIYIEENDIIEMCIAAAIIVGMYIVYRIIKHFCKKK
jgi:uncharacterized protein YneF (UPF0154 family)